MQLILYRSRQSPKVCPQSKRAAMRDQELGSELFFKKNSKLQVCMCTQGLSPQRIWPTLELQGCWELNSSGGAIQVLNC